MLHDSRMHYSFLSTLFMACHIFFASANTSALQIANSIGVVSTTCCNGRQVLQGALPRSSESSCQPYQQLMQHGGAIPEPTVQVLCLRVRWENNGTAEPND